MLQPPTANFNYVNYVSSPRFHCCRFNWALRIGGLGFWDLRFLITCGKNNSEDGQERNECAGAFCSHKTCDATDNEAACIVQECVCAAGDEKGHLGTNGRFTAAVVRDLFPLHLGQCDSAAAHLQK